MEVAFHDMKHTIYVENILNYPDWKILFTLHIYAFDKQLGAIISQNYKPVD